MEVCRDPNERKLTFDENCERPKVLIQIVRERLKRRVNAKACLVTWLLKILWICFLVSVLNYIVTYVIRINGIYGSVSAV